MSEFLPFASRRSVVHSTEGIIACTQPLAAKCGLKILAAGGNAADAAVAVAAGLNLTEPMSTGIGGDMFCLYYDAKTKKVSALNGSGRAGLNCTLDAVREALGHKHGDAVGSIPIKHVHTVTVPGAAAGWVDTVEGFGSGKVTLKEILEPAAQLGDKGFPVSEICAGYWKKGESLLQEASANHGEMLIKEADGTHRSPREGELFRNPHLAATFRALGQDGKKGFYTGRIASEIIKVTRDLGGFLTLDDLTHHMEVGSEPVEAISKIFKSQGYGSGPGDDPKGIEVWEHPPNGQGIVALMALGILEELEKAGKIPVFKKEDHNTAPYLHALIEALRISFADASWYVSDPSISQIPVSELLSQEYLATRAALFDSSRANPAIYDHGSPAHTHSDTVYFAVSDKDGNAISFINSNYEGFGSAIIPAGCGFVLQNRGGNFNLQPGHPNVIAPRKRPYHTIIPALTTNASDGTLHSVYGVMGGFMQPQGHVQVLLNQLVFKHNPQAALDAPRFCIGAEGVVSSDQGKAVYLEDGISPEVCEELRGMGHAAVIVKGSARGTFGRGQVIRCNVQRGVEGGQVVWSAGSDLRGDGAAYPA